MPVICTIDAVDRGTRGGQFIYIYFLCDQADGRPRYVGQTVNPYNRLQEHWSGYASVDAHHWIAGLKSEGRRLRMCIVEVVPSLKAASAERRWAEQMWDDGEDLLNQMMLIPKRWERHINQTYKWRAEKKNNDHE